MDKKYRVVFLGLIESKENFTQGMSGLGVSSSVVGKMIEKAPVILKGDMTLGDARQYADAVQHAGGRVNIQEHGLFEEQNLSNRSSDIKLLDDFIMCPECGHKQLKAEVCVRCGRIYKEG